MGWWPFSRKGGDGNRARDVHIKGTRVWIQDLRQTCERYYNLPTQAHSLIREMQIEWKEAYQREEINSELFEGLERRAFHLLRADDGEWIKMLDDLEFWKPGWRP